MRRLAGSGLVAVRDRVLFSSVSLSRVVGTLWHDLACNVVDRTMQNKGYQNDMVMVSMVVGVGVTGCHADGANFQFAQIYEIPLMKPIPIINYRRGRTWCKQISKTVLLKTVLLKTV